MKPENMTHLKGGLLHVTENPDSVVTVIEGTALVYIIPMRNDSSKTLGRRLFLCEIEKGGKIPSLAYTDFDGISWHIGITALEECILGESESDEIDSCRDAFAERVRLANYEMEGFEEGLADWYRMNKVKEDGYLHTTAKERRKIYEDGLTLIYNLFSERKNAAVTSGGDDALYRAARLLCEKSRIPIADYEKVRSVCQDELTMETIARVSHFTVRRIVPDEGWYKTDIGNVIAFSAEDETKAYVCTPKKRGGYLCHDPITGTAKVVTAELAATLSHKMYMCYRPFGSKKMTLPSLLKFALGSISPSDLFRIFALTLIGALIGLLIPTLNQQLYDIYIPSRLETPFVGVALAVLAFMLGRVAFDAVSSMSRFRMTGRITADVQSAVYDRLFNLPEHFFRNYDSGDLAQRAMGIGELVNNVIELILSCGMTLVFCVVYFVQMARYSSVLSAVGLVLILLYTAFSVFCSLKTMKHEKAIMALDGKTDSVMLQLLCGIAKIRIAGAEDRALYEYLKPFTEQRRKELESERISMLASAASRVFDSVITIVIYVLMVRLDLGLTVGVFIAFNSAFGSFASSVVSLADSLVSTSYIRPMYDRVRDITETLPEDDDEKEIPGDLSGDIEVSNVSFTYDENSPNVLDGVRLHIKSGEYVGIVGPSGCGKSTLFKLLLGFEKPKSGKIYYDNRDIDALDKRELRKKLGVVLQNGKLIAGSIYDNITITCPEASIEDVEEVIAAVGLENDIREMPMGLHTVIDEECGTISGGQMQRILIARAIVGKPRILFFDEATSALDNLTQRMVCESLDKLNATRVVIAHRLSTIAHCDRIIVMENGRIVEEGSYDELCKLGGLFARLAERQTV